MANTFAVSRSHLIYGLCLPVAVVIGYLLAEPLESGSVAVVVLVLSILSIPLLMRWHHPLLIFSCNAVIVPYFLPGQPSLWMLMTLVSLFFSVLNRSLGQDVRFFPARSVACSMLFIGVVALGTAWLTGGIGLSAAGSSSIGGKKYVYIILAIALYFALTASHIKQNRVGWYAGLFFLSALTALVGYVAAVGGHSFYFLEELFPIDLTLNEIMANQIVPGSEGISRLTTLVLPAIGLFCFLLARYGARGVLDARKPWRLLLLLMAFVMNLYAGFRSNVILLSATFAAMFYIEGLFRTRYFQVIMLIGALAAAIVLSNPRILPLPVQRALTILPIAVDPIARLDAEGSSTWRLQIWQRLLPDIPKYLIIGKGYSINPDELAMLQVGKGDVALMSQEGALLSGDYHSGPLSVVIPFGILGVAGLIWFWAASVKVLLQNYRFGDTSLHRINAFLLGYFVVKILMFILVFGSLYSDLGQFAALVGLSVSLNHGVCRPPEETPETVTND